AQNVAACALRIRDGVDAAQCTVSGYGITVYHTGDNSVAVAAVDSEGDVVESIEAEDLCVSVEGGSVVSVALTAMGHVAIVYRVPADRLEPVYVQMSVCGAVVPGSPWTVTSPLGDSANLATVAPERITAFLRELSGWLPRRAYMLLYRGSRDGMTPAAFHRLCDDKGPTLVLVRCSDGWVFGGHAGASWETDPRGPTHVASADAFLFSVTGPHTSAPVRFPVKEGNVDRALSCNPFYGPCFGGGLILASGNWAPEGVIDGREAFAGLATATRMCWDRGRAASLAAKSSHLWTSRCTRLHACDSISRPQWTS
ncbi:MAG: TLD domain-containing protein, partial [Terracidiphilus sp.]|nr:TLD domain-containing protein [Terracidiphilus sp.]